MSYTICSSCGQKALQVATRCPRCGLAFEEQFLSRSRPARPPRRVPFVLLLTGTVVTVLLANALRRSVTLQQEGMTPAPTPPAVVAAAPVAPPVAAAPSPIAAADTFAPDSSPRRDSARPPAVVAAAPAPAPAAVVPPPTPPVPSAATTVTDPGQHRTASTWVNVRASRSSAAPVLGVLSPREVVRVDSLLAGWYRVITDRFPPGYADRRLLDVAQGPVAP
jgi:hypothetical protein